MAFHTYSLYINDDPTINPRVRVSEIKPSAFSPDYQTFCINVDDVSMFVTREQYRYLLDAMQNAYMAATADEEVEVYAASD